MTPPPVSPSTCPPLPVRLTPPSNKPECSPPPLQTSIMRTPCSTDSNHNLLPKNLHAPPQSPPATTNLMPPSRNQASIARLSCWTSHRPRNKRLSNPDPLQQTRTIPAPAPPTDLMPPPFPTLPSQNTPKPSPALLNKPDASVPQPEVDRPPQLHQPPVSTNRTAAPQPRRNLNVLPVLQTQTPRPAPHPHPLKQTPCLPPQPNPPPIPTATPPSPNKRHGSAPSQESTARLSCTSSRPRQI